MNPEKKNVIYVAFSHNSKYDTYAGYWAFDVAAVAKVFHVPDSPKWKYYPYDLAHYKREA